MNTSLVSDLSDAVPVCPQLELYLKPIAKVNISVGLPKLKVPGQTVSNWELMEKIKLMCTPHQFSVLRVSKSTVDFVRFEGEVENKSLIKTFISQLDGKFIKLSGFPDAQKVSCGETKVPFPSRHDWDSFFRDSGQFNEMEPGKRPDTIHLKDVPCKFFTNKKKQNVDEDLVKLAFLPFGEIRNIDIPMLDPYRSDQTSTNSNGGNFQTFSFGSRLNFEMYIQYREYIGFAKCMDEFRGKKLVMKETDGKAIAATVKVDFDKTKHLSLQSINHRKLEREKIEKLQQKRRDEKRKEREEAERKIKAEKLREKAIRDEQEERRRKREEKRRRKKKEKKEKEEAEKLSLRIATEERKLLLAQRKLESIRILSELFERIKEELVLEEKLKLAREIALKEEMERKRKEEEEKRKREQEEKRRKDKEERKQEKMRRKELELKSRLLKRKLEEDYKKGAKKKKDKLKKSKHSKSSSHRSPSNHWSP